MPVTYYSLGFAFNQSLTHVALIKKKRPGWQAGFLNGVGGHMEEKETPQQTMAREFWEETGVATLLSEWVKVGSIARADDFFCHLFKATLRDSDFFSAKTTTDEEVELFPLEEIYKYRHRLLPNLPGLIGLCLDPQMPVTTMVYNDAPVS